MPVVVPFGGHAVFIDARALLPHIDPLAYPGQALACALYLEGGVRSCEIGTVMFGLHPDGTETPAAMDLVRLAIPRRTYTQSHIDYVIEVVTRVAEPGSRPARHANRLPAQAAAPLHRTVRARRAEHFQRLPGPPPTGQEPGGRRGGRRRRKRHRPIRVGPSPLTTAILTAPMRQISRFGANQTDRSRVGNNANNGGSVRVSVVGQVCPAGLALRRVGLLGRVGEIVPGPAGPGWPLAVSPVPDSAPCSRARCCSAGLLAIRPS